MAAIKWALAGALLAVFFLAAEGEGAVPPRHRRGAFVAPSQGLTQHRSRRSEPLDTSDYDYNNDEAEDYDDGSDEDEEENKTPHPPPTFYSKPTSFSNRPGDNVLLPCHVTDKGNLVQMWLNGTSTITINEKSLNDRVERLDNLSLLIRDVKPEDSGTYTCQIASDPVVNLTHTLIVPSPAKIVSHSQKQSVILGQRLILTCNAEGSPKPQITWRLHDRPVPDAIIRDDGSTLEVTHVNRNHSGAYKCEADNKRGNAVNATIMVAIIIVPEVTIEKAVVKSGEGESAELVCYANGQPKPSVKWRKNGVDVKSDRIQLQQEPPRYKLIIKDIDKGDFGKYTCNAKNKHGNAEKEILLSGTPDVPKYIATNTGDDKITLVWEVLSYAPIVQYELLYKKKGTEEWHSLRPKVETVDGNIYRVNIDLPNVTAGEYEAKFRSENEFGWTDSDVVNFQGRDKIRPMEEETSLEDQKQPAADSSKAGPDNSATISVLNAFTLFGALMTVFTLRASSSHL